MFLILLAAEKDVNISKNNLIFNKKFFIFIIIIKFYSALL